MSALVVPVALAAAVSFGWSTAAMHHDASTAPEGLHRPLDLLAHLVRQWRWLTGMVASLTGLGLHAVALNLGSLAVVQPLVVSGLVFSLLFRSALDHTWPSRAVLGWALVTAVGLAVFLVSARSTTGSRRPGTVAATVVLLLGVAAAAALWRAARGRRPGLRGLLLGAGTGINFGLTAGSLKAVSDGPGLPGVLTSWPLYVLLALGASGFVANQITYRAAPLPASLPMLNVANPLVALLFGVVAFAERPATTAVTWVAETVGLLVVLTGVFMLARQEAAVAADAAQTVKGESAVAA